MSTVPANAGAQRIADAFAGSGKRAALMPYLMGGFPDAAVSRAIGAAYADGGADLVELAREISRRHPTLPIILTTGYVEAASRMKDGEFHLLLKPYSLEALAAALGVEVT